MTGPVAALAAVVLLSAAAQVLLKRGTAGLVFGRGLNRLIASVTPSMAAGVVALAVAPPLYFYTLTRMDLSIAFAGTALTQGAVILGGRFLLGEKLNPRHLAGTLLVVAGLLVWNL